MFIDCVEMNSLSHLCEAKKDSHPLLFNLLQRLDKHLEPYGCPKESKTAYEDVSVWDSDHGVHFPANSYIFRL